MIALCLAALKDTARSIARYQTLNQFGARLSLMKIRITAQERSCNFLLEREGEEKREILRERIHAEIMQFMLVYNDGN